MSFRFANPEWLNVIPWIVGIGFALFFYDLSRVKRSYSVFSERMGSYLFQSVSLTKRRLHLFLQCLILIFICLALARPQLGGREQQVKQMGLELVIAIDVSNSMLAEDLRPSRLALAKNKMIKFLDLLHGDRVGLVAFAGSAVLLSPMTSDYNALKIFISSISPDSVSTQGTNFKALLDASIGAFERGGIEDSEMNKSTRAVIVISDGEDQEPGLDAALKKAVDKGLRVFSWGFGTRQGAPIPMRDERGNLKDYKKHNGEMIMSVPNEKVLASLAEKGGGAYYHAVYDDSEIKSLADDIGKLQRAEMTSRLQVDYDEKFQIPLLLAVLLAFLDLSFGERKKASLEWKGRFETSS